MHGQEQTDDDRVKEVTRIYMLLEKDSCQTVYDMARKNVMDKIQETNTHNGKMRETKQPKKIKLISGYTFNRQEARDFSNILSGDNAYASGSRYAFLKVDEESSRASFAPLVFHSPNVSEQGWGMSGNVGIDVEVDNDQIFTVFDENGLNGEVGFFANVNIKLRHRKYYLEGTQKTEKYSQFDHENLTQSMKMDTIRKYYMKCLEDEGYTKDCFTLCELDPKKKEKELMEQFMDYEEKAADKYWTRDVKQWLTIGLFGQYNGVYGIDTNTLSLDDLSFYSVNAKFTYNYLSKWHNGKATPSLYLKAWVGAENRNIFTEMQASDWNQMTKLTDSTYILADQKTAYLYEPTNYQHRYCMSAGFQGIFMMEFGDADIIKDLSVGLDVQYQYKGITPAVLGGPGINKNYGSVGIIIPFKDNEGKSTINIELFRAFTRYSATAFDSQDFWGVKFSVPIL